MSKYKITKYDCKGWRTVKKCMILNKFGITVKKTDWNQLLRDIKVLYH